MANKTIRGRQASAPKKRLGRPPKAAVSGQRISLGLRVPANLKRALGNAAKASGRSLSQEAELRLENSLKSDGNLMLVQGHKATPIVFQQDKTRGPVYAANMLIPLSYGVVTLPIDSDDKHELLNFFGEQWSLERQEWPKPTETTGGESLGLRVTPELKGALDRAASRSHTSQSQQVVWRLWNSINSDKHLLLVQGYQATPIIFEQGKMCVPLTDVAPGATMSDLSDVDREYARAIPISSCDRDSILEFFRDQWPDPGGEWQEMEMDEAADWYDETLRGR